MYQMTNNFIPNVPDYSGIGMYALINDSNGKMYIGSSKNIHQRIIQHKSAPPSALKADIQQGNTFSVKILEKLPFGCNQFDMFNRESFYIQKYETLSNGYNHAKTTCSTKEELLNSLATFKGNHEMTNYINNIIAKRERPIYATKKQLAITIPSDFFEFIRAHAESQGESMNQFVIRAIDETMERDNNAN